MTSRPLRLAIDTGPLYGHRTGVAVAVDGMLHGLEQRADVSTAPYLVSFRSDPQSGHRRLPVPGIVASHLWSRIDHPRADRWLRDVDVVHGTNYVAPPTGLPTVISVYDCWFLSHPELATPMVRRAAATLRRAVDRGAWIHASSDATAHTARSLLQTDRVATVRLGPPPAPAAAEDLTTPTIAGQLAAKLEGHPFVVSIATEERRKALPVLVGAFEIVAGDDANVHLVLAGAAGTETDTITEAIEALAAPIRARVHRLGRVDEMTKHWLIRHASTLAYPSLDEGFGFPILESQLAGTPVVASATGAIPEIAGTAAVLVEGHRPDDFANGLRRVLASGVERLGLIEAGYRNAGRFSWDATASGLVELYQRALESS